jgi:hypothetical protein
MKLHAAPGGKSRSFAIVFIIGTVVPPSTYLIYRF